MTNLAFTSLADAKPLGESPLVVASLNKRYKRGVWANRDISLTVEPGETLGILGPNGAGKTTLIRQITTELIPTSGTIRVMGYDAIKEPYKAKSLLGIVPQEATLFDYLTVYQHLRIFGQLRGYNGRGAARRADELIEELRLTEHRNVPIKKISGGMRRRILIGIAALAHPPLMVLDEPTTGLDPQSRRDLWVQLRHYKQTQTAVIITTHYMEEAEALCDRVGIILNGRLLALDTVANLRGSYSYEYKITYSANDSGGESETIYGAAYQELVERVRAVGGENLTLSRTSLEDVYLAITGGGDSGEDGRT